MEKASNIPIAYPDWFADWKKRIQSAQIKAALHVSRELLLLYWELGQDIAAKQETTPWGEGLIPRFSKDLKAAFPHLTGFSRTNLFYVKKWYLFYKEAFAPIVQQGAGQLGEEVAPLLNIEEVVIVPQVAGQLGGVSVQQVAAQLQPFDNE